MPNKDAGAIVCIKCSPKLFLFRPFPFKNGIHRPSMVEESRLLREGREVGDEGRRREVKEWEKTGRRRRIEIHLCLSHSL